MVQQQTVQQLMELKRMEQLVIKQRIQQEVKHQNPAINHTFSKYWKYLFDILFSDQFCKFKILLYNQNLIQ
jgi:hypothetical protein